MDGGVNSCDIPQEGGDNLENNASEKEDEDGQDCKIVVIVGVEASEGIIELNPSVVHLCFLCFNIPLVYNELHGNFNSGLIYFMNHQGWLHLHARDGKFWSAKTEMT
ncbi:hypothetical protein ACJX0J_023901 [Zea mays]